MPDWDTDFAASMTRFHDRLRVFVESIPADTPASIAADKFIEGLDDDALLELDQWVTEQIDFLLALRIKQLRKMQPTGRKKLTPARSFSIAADGFATGDVSSLSDFRLVYHLASGEKALGDMTSRDHHEACDMFQARGTNMLMLAAIHRQVARVLPLGKTTKEVLTQEQYARLFRNFKAVEPSN